MRFHKKKGRQHLDMTGDLLLHKAGKPVSATTPSAMPHTIKGGHRVCVQKGGRIWATINALNFIWTA